MEADELLKQLKARLPEELRGKIGAFECFGNRSNKIKVHVEPPYAVEISLLFKQVLMDEANLYKERKLWTKVEKDAKEHFRYEKVGKAKAFLNVKTKSKNAESYAKCSYNPYWLLTCHTGDDVVEMGLADEMGEITRNDANTQAAFQLTAEAINREFWAHKRP